MEGQGDPYLRCCLATIDCAQHMHIFIENEIDFDCFKSLSKDELGTLLTGKIGPLKKISTEIERLRAIDEGTVKVQPTIPEVATSPPIQRTQTQGTQSSAGLAPKESVKNGLPLSSKVMEGGSTKVRSTQGTPTSAAGTQTKPVDESILAKYGFQLPSAGAFVTSIAVGTVQKHIIDNFTHPLVFGGPDATTTGTSCGTGAGGTGAGGTGAVAGGTGAVAGGTGAEAGGTAAVAGGTGASATGTNGTVTGGTATGGTVAGGTGVGIGGRSIPAQEGNDPAMNDYLAKYGHPKDANPMGKSMVHPNDETGDLTITNETGADYSTDIADVQDFQDVGAVDGDFGVIDPTVTDVGTEDGGIADLIGGIVSMFTSGDTV